MFFFNGPEWQFIVVFFGISMKSHEKSKDFAKSRICRRTDTHVAGTDSDAHTHYRQHLIRYFSKTKKVRAVLVTPPDLNFFAKFYF